MHVIFYGRGSESNTSLSLHAQSLRALFALSRSSAVSSRDQATSFLADIPMLSERMVPLGLSNMKNSTCPNLEVSHQDPNSRLDDPILLSSCSHLLFHFHSLCNCKVSLFHSFIPFSHWVRGVRGFRSCRSNMPLRPPLHLVFFHVVPYPSPLLRDTFSRYRIRTNHGGGSLSLLVCSPRSSASFPFLRPGMCFGEVKPQINSRLLCLLVALFLSLSLSIPKRSKENQTAKMSCWGHRRSPNSFLFINNG